MEQKRVIGGGILALLLTTTAVQADVTAEQVWSNWKALVTAGGQTITTGSESKTGDTLVVRDMTLTSSLEGGQMTGRMAEIDLREQGDGSVAVTMSPDLTFDMAMAPPEGKPVEMQLVISQSGMTMIASGSPGDMTYDYAIPTLSVKVDGLKVDGEAIEMSADIGATGLKGKNLVRGTDTRTIASSGTLDSLTYRIAGKQPDPVGTFDMSGKLTGLTTTSNATLLPKTDMADLNAALQAGMALDGSLTFSSTESSSDFTEGGNSTHSESSSDAGSLSFALDKTKLAYGVDSKNMKVTIQDSQIPLPQVTFELADTAIKLLMPVAKSETPQDFGLLVKLAGLKVNDEIWGMIDPAKVLPRDPATLVVDLAGKANWLFDIFDPAQQATPPEVPGELHALDLKQLDLAIAGAELTGTGGFTFDNSDMTTFDGIPKPTGSIDLKLVGGNGLIDKLVQMGLVPADQASGARMMLGLFARPGDGPDTMVSKIEVTPEGEVLANGQRLQ